MVIVDWEGLVSIVIIETMLTMCKENLFIRNGTVVFSRFVGCNCSKQGYIIMWLGFLAVSFFEDSLREMPSKEV